MKGSEGKSVSFETYMATFSYLYLRLITVISKHVLIKELIKRNYNFVLTGYCRPAVLLLFWSAVICKKTTTNYLHLKLCLKHSYFLRPLNYVNVSVCRYYFECYTIMLHLPFITYISFFNARHILFLCNEMCSINKLPCLAQLCRLPVTESGCQFTTISQYIAHIASNCRCFWGLRE